MGNPTPESPVIVTGNYKLTFDAVRKELHSLDAWLLVTDTRGINIWCAAGKSLFSTDEILYSVQRTHLSNIVSHRTLILPQLGATGVSAHTVHKGCGFKVVYGPVRAADLKEFIAADSKATDSMRTVTFTLRERAELIPVELFILGKPLLILFLAAFVLSGIGPNFFSISDAWQRGLAATVATLLGIVAGNIIVPLFLPKLPWKMFAPKGAFIGLFTGSINIILLHATFGAGELLALWLWTISVGAYMAMNFTGSTPFTSPTGVEKEMRQIIPILAATTSLILIIWVSAPFIE